MIEDSLQIWYYKRKMYNWNAKSVKIKILTVPSLTVPFNFKSDFNCNTIRVIT